GKLGQRRERRLLEGFGVDEVRVDEAYPFEVRRDLLRGAGYSALTGSVELLGHQHVLGYLDRVFQQSVDQDDVEPDEVSPVPDGLRGHLGDVRHELQREVVYLAAGAGTQVGGD